MDRSVLHTRVHDADILGTVRVYAVCVVALDVVVVYLHAVYRHIRAELGDNVPRRRILQEQNRNLANANFESRLPWHPPPTYQFKTL
jgi:hypothetical protein